MPFKDLFGVVYSDDRQVLMKCPQSIVGSYTVSPMANTIGRGAFEGCDKLEELILPDWLDNIEADAFKGCTSLKSIRLPKRLKSFKYPIFRDCNILHLLLPDEIDEHLGRMLIETCSKLVDVSINDNNVSFCKDNDAIYSKDRTKLIFLSRNYEGTFFLPKTVKLIYVLGIRNCQKLQSIVLPKLFEGFTETSTPLYGCTSLSSIVVDETNPHFCSYDGVLYSKNGKELLRCPEGKTGKFKPVFQVETIRKCAFKH